MGSEDTLPHGAIAPDWKSLLTWVWLRVRFDLDEPCAVDGPQPLRSAAADSG